MAYAVTGVDLTCYKIPQMLRRLPVLIARTHVHGYAEYAALLARDSERRQEFRDFVTINVSEFFRDPQRFSVLETRILPDLIAGRSAIRAWSAGCSIGAEAYSLAMIFAERMRAALCTTLATDIDEGILARARRGAGYSQAEVRSVPETRLSRWFTKEQDRYTIRSDIRSMVHFRRHDLARDPCPTGWFDLIVCRNVVIYFTEEAKEETLRRFVSVLRPGGVLFLGGSEAVLRPGDLGLVPLESGFYRRGT